MRRLSSFLTTAIGLILLLDCSLASAQSSYLYTIGSPTWGTQIPIEDGYIVVNNGEVHLEISLATHPQRGSLKLDEALVYDSRIWQIVPSGSSYSWQPVNVPNSQTGWRFVSGSEAGSVQTWGSSSTSQCPNNGSQWFTYTTYAFTWDDPSGTSHYFTPGTGQVTQNSCTWNGGEPSQPTGTAYAWDTSGYYMTVSSYTTAIVYDPNGNQVYPNPMDTNGNSFTTDGSGNLVDTIGRTPVKVSTNGNQTYYDVLTVGGATKRYTVTTETINVHTAFGQSAVSEYSGSLTAIQSIALPDGSSYSFNYDSGTSSGYYGELTGMTLPTGGTVSFGWMNYQDSYQNQNRWLETYSGGMGSDTFEPVVVSQCQGSNETGCQERVTVVDGNNNQVQYLFTLNNGAWNSQMDYYTQGGAHLLTTATNYNFASGSQYIQAQSQTTTLDDTAQKTQTVYTYQSPFYDKPSALQEWDYYTGTPPATPTRETDYVYNYSINGASLPTQRTVKDATGTVVAQTTWNYDGQANVTSTVSGTNGTSVTTSTGYDSNGMPTWTKDGNGNTTNYSYGCSDAYPSAAVYPIVVNGQNLQSQTGYDCSTGLVTWTKDPNGVVNNFATNDSYFTSGANVGRLQSVAYPDGGSTTYSYPSPTEMDTSVAQTSTTSVTTKTILDLFGRPYQVVTVAPEGNISSETTYDGTGRPYCVWTPHLSTSSPTDGKTCTSYDVLGRKTSVSFPDGNAITLNYSGNTQTVTATGAVFGFSMQTLTAGAVAARLGVTPWAQLKNYGLRNAPHKEEMIRQGMQYKQNDCGKF